MLRLIRLAGVVPILASLTLTTTTETAIAKTHRTSKCVVPELAGLTLSKARTKLSSAHCAVGVVLGDRSGVVAEQSPRAGVRRKNGARIAIALNAPTATYASSVQLSYVPTPGNPLQVSYTVSADVLETLGSEHIDLGAKGRLPAGVVSVYSNGELVCALNVGGGTTGGACNATYSVAGSYSVIVEYSAPPVTSVTTTEAVTVG